MNLTTIFLTLAMGGVSVEEAYQQRQIEFTGGPYQNVTFRYRLLVPQELEAGKTYPLVIFLHGAGERGTDNAAQLQYFPTVMASPESQRKYPAFVLAPQCRPEARWVEVDWGDKKSTELADEPGPQLQVVLQIVDQLIGVSPIDRRRIYLTGLSMGGYGTWDLAMRRPKFFAAIAPICGGGDEREAARLAGVPIYAYHGDQDTAVPVERSRQMIEAVKAAGGAPKYKELPGVGHNSWDAAYSDADGVVPWMFEQRRSD